jgi:hypothetical protein
LNDPIFSGFLRSERFYFQSGLHFAAGFETISPARRAYLSKLMRTLGITRGISPQLRERAGLRLMDFRHSSVTLSDEGRNFQKRST